MAKITNHRVLNSSRLILKRYKHIPPGGNVMSAPKHIRPKRYQDPAYCKRYSPNSVSRRIRYNLPSPTVVACTGANGEFIHPVLDRLLSLRERARLQTFPDSFEFIGSFGSIHSQIGNAVPPKLAMKLAQAMKTW